MTNLADKPYGSFILGFLVATLVSTSLGRPDAESDQGGHRTATRPNHPEPTLSDETVSVSPKAADTARLWADLLTDGWEHLVDPVSFDELAIEYCARRKEAMSRHPAPDIDIDMNMDMAATAAVDDWARTTLGYEHRTKQDRHTVASVVTAMGYGCIGAGWADRADTTR